MTDGLNVVIFLVVGLLIAAALQLLLTSLGLALGLTALGWVLKTDQEEPAQDAQDQSVGKFPIAPLIGFGVALSLSLVLFGASLLTIEFFQEPEPRRAAIFGLMLWACYWLLLVWFSSTALTGLVNSLWETAIASARQLMTSIGQLFRGQATNGNDQDPLLLQNLAAEVAQLADVQRQLPDLLAQQRDILIAEISERANLSPDQAEAVVTQLQPVPPDPRRPGPDSSISDLLSQLDLPSWQQLVRQLLNQVDLSDLDMETLWQRLQSLREDRSSLELPPSENVIRLDAEDYICRAPAWSLQPEVLEQEFSARIYDPDAAPEQVQEQLAQLNRSDFVDWLHQRGDLAAAQIDTIADDLSQIQQAVMARVSSPPPQPATAEPSSALQEMEDKLLAYCRYTNLDLLTADSLTEKVQNLQQELAGPEGGALTALQPLDLAAMTDVLSRRQGITATQQQRLTDALIQALGQEASHRQTHSPWSESVRQRLEAYFQSVDWSAVSLEDLKPEVVNQLRSLDLQGNLDWQSLGARLQVPEEIKADLLDWLQETGHTLSRRPRRWAVRVGQSTQSVVQYLIRQISHYLKFQDKAALRPGQIAQDLTAMLNNVVEILPDPAAWSQLSNLQAVADIASLQQLLENRRDLTADQIQQILDALENSWQQGTQNILHWTQTLWAEAQDLLGAETESLDAMRHRLVDQIADGRQALQNQAAQVKANLQRQTDGARRQVAIAAWWFFFSLISSAGAAMVAGWLAVRY